MKIIKNSFLFFLDYLFKEENYNNMNESEKFLREQEKLKAKQIKEEKAKTKAIQKAEKQSFVSKIKEQKKVANEQKILSENKKAIQNDVMRANDSINKKAISDTTKDLADASNENNISAKKEKTLIAKIFIPKINNESEVSPIKLQNPESIAVVASESETEISDKSKKKIV